MNPFLLVLKLKGLGILIMLGLVLFIVFKLRQKKK